MEVGIYIVFLLIGSGAGYWAGTRKKQEKLIAAEATNEATNSALEKQLAEKKQETQQITEKLEKSTKELAGAEARIGAFTKAQEQSKQEFENLANKILKKTSADFKEQSETSLKNLLNPLDRQIKEFKTEITGFKAINESMKSETENLTNALTSNIKAQGNWGELTLERILEESGLTEGLEYTAQGAGMELKSADGGRQMPDVIINLPENKHIIIDSKVSLKHYTAYQAASNKAEEMEAIKGFITSTERHIKGLSDKNYQDTYGLRSLDFVMMFMPLEASYFLLMQEKEGIIAKAWDKNIAIVCPSTLLPNLRTIGYLWRLQKQNENVEEIARLGGAIYDKVHGFLGNMEETGKAIDKAKDKHDEAVKQLSEGRGNVLNQTEKLKKLGAKTNKSLPQNLFSD